MASEGPKTGYFNVHKYNDSREQHGRTKFVSPSDAIANNHAMVVSFQHEPSGQSVFFKAFISSLNESFSSDWIEEVVYGRTDPIQLFKNTTRRISLGLKIPAETFGEAYDNLGRVAQLTQFLYPVYSKAGGDADSDIGWVPSQGPLIRLKVMNLIAKPREEDDRPTNYESYKSSADPALGLLGAISSLSISHNLETPDVTTFAKDSNTVLPGLIELSMEFVAIHEVDNKERPFLGWSDDAAPKFNDETFPYGVTLMSDDNATIAMIQHKQEQAIAQQHDASAIPPNEQARLDAAKRYSAGTGFLGGNPAKTLEKDLAWLAKHTGKLGVMNTGLTAAQQQNYEYLKSATSYLVDIDDFEGGRLTPEYRDRLTEFGIRQKRGEFDMID